MLHIEIENIQITYAIYTDGKIRTPFYGGHIEIMLLIQIETLELTGGHIEIMLFIEIETLKFDSKVVILK